ncbi:hypothetical protein L1987_85951 [Smallanthus sonchifolius]|uniref:Uncharacterized protein n=1 Tax=Smallanthus sonchifolius TaxID=185202 RepID=A0ACB8XZ67_9ASTR|nr:hypothetical protein L1987_85951 [Smallanthus sonchifolius]
MAKANEVQFVAPHPSRRDRFAEMTGMKEPCTITVRNPIRTRTKGYGTQKRLKSAREISISQAGEKNKGMRFCKVAGHSLRTCKLYIANLKEKESSASLGVDNIQV